MKYFISTIILLFSYSNLYSQNKCVDFIEKEIIEKIKNYDSKDIIPYYSEKESAWGYFDIKSKQKVIAPIFREYIFFNSYIFIDFEEDIKTLNSSLNKCNVRLYGSSEKFKIELPDTTSISFISYYENDKKNKIKNIKGFELNSKNELIACNKKFYNEKDNTSNLRDFFKINATNYAVFKDNGKYSVVSEDGNFIKGFKNMISEPKIIYFDNKDVLFFIEDKSNKYKVKSLFNTLVCNEVFDSEIYFTTANVVGYQKVKKKDVFGIFDFINFKWVVEPNNSIDIDSFEYSTNFDFYEGILVYEKYNILKNRNLADFYIITNDNKVFDLNLTEIKPIEN